MSVEAVHVRLIAEEEMAVALRLAGAVGGVVLLIEMAAVADFVESAMEVAFRETEAGFGAVAGAV